MEANGRAFDDVETFLERTAARKSLATRERVGIRRSRQECSYSSMVAVLRPYRTREVGGRNAIDPAIRFNDSDTPSTPRCRKHQAKWIPPITGQRNGTIKPPERSFVARSSSS